jgi:hypothetical protein
MLGAGEIVQLEGLEWRVFMTSERKTWRFSSHRHFANAREPFPPEILTLHCVVVDQYVSEIDVCCCSLRGQRHGMYKACGTNETGME